MMKTREEIGTATREYIRKNFLYSDSQTLADGQSLLGTGVVDSTGILELITFLEENFDLRFMDEELVADNFDSVDRISAFIHEKLTGVEV
jgi:acyl carrier protein